MGVGSFVRDYLLIVRCYVGVLDRLFSRESHAEHRAGIGAVAVDINPPPVQLHHSLGDKQSDSETV